MPTLPPSPSHQARAMAESFGVDAERYDRARPPYPQALIERIVALSPGTDVLDIGCGTGIASGQLQALGCHVVGVDPDPRMAALARQKGTEVEVATFETWDPANRSFDAAIAAQSWHWVDPVAGAAKVARALRPNGVFAIFWHVYQPPPEATEALAAALERAVPDLPFKPAANGNDLLTKRVLEGLHQAGAFHEPEQTRYHTDLDYTRDAYLDHLPTTGGLTRLPPDKLADVLAAVSEAVDDTFTFHLETVALIATRI